uniref:Cytochrome c oxidase subunit 3 n=1 Tax=Stenopsyche tienmushanensis TaxID=1560151 RepID=A0A8A0XX19_9NEOP|nr:cytochrome c oxidase subunit III [Stenopsyche tienmushanensis]QSQ87272.1 cytochrome c oxidase subunit III [Stenopsyche tienmushanensis]UDU84909.1 cytochrome c oxidase subunit 3 [Stenopsyche tienmushanensis]
MTTHSNHPFHLVTYSPWPLSGSLGTMIMMMGMIQWFHSFHLNILMLTGLTIIILTMIQWWRDVTRESTLQGCHTIKVTNNMKWGMMLFITSEVFFFFSFFWAFFHSSLSPNIELGSMWPPQNIKPFNPFTIPLLNTMILLSSGISVTWSHHSLIMNNFYQAYYSLLITIILGIYFTGLQALEYYEAPFTIADSIYGSIFFLTTGFHGLHVIIGTIFLLVCLIRHYNNHFSSNHHFGFEAASWYWHFVDVVWLFLFVSVYWWSK